MIEANGETYRNTLQEWVDRGKTSSAITENGWEQQLTNEKGRNMKLNQQWQPYVAEKRNAIQNIEATYIT